ncbi:MAG: 1-phosphofructokinase family hexose kinase [Bacteroidetes bacterium]|nr:MAG: 1-phosphofructokinase family hexose kinase [Bacteroidota bacterium]
MIVTITFSPSMDKSVSVKQLLPETKMKCFDEATYPGGGGINVARVLTRFGCDVTALFPANLFNVPFFKKTLGAENVLFVVIPTVNETRESIAVFDEQSQKQYRLVMPGNTLSPTEWSNCLRAIKKLKEVNFIVVSGSLPKHAPPAIFSQLSKIAMAKKAKLVIDTSGKSLKKAIEVPLFLIKPNLEEFGILIGNKGLKRAALKKQAQLFLNKYPCEFLVVSLGSKGAMLFNKEHTFSITPPTVKVKSTVGAGDSMLAGMLYALQKGLDMKECLKTGIAFGTATTLKAGTSLCTKADVAKLMQKMDR